MSVEIISGLAFVGVTALMLALIHRLRRDDQMIDGRLEELRHDLANSNRTRSQPGRTSRLLGRISPRLAKHLLPDDEGQRTRLQARLLHAGIYHPSALYVYLVAKPALMVVPGVVALLLVGIGACSLQYGLLYGALGAVLGSMVPSYWLDRRKARRHIRLNRSLPDFLDLLVTCMEGGLSLEGALQRVTKELRIAHGELAAEMERVQREIELGTTPDAALKNLAERADLESIGMLASFVQQARRFGTCMGDALRIHAESIRIAREQRAEELAQKASVKILFPTLLFIFPAIFVVLAGPAAIQLAEVFAPRSSDSPMNEGD
ncbi:MAG: type II secretion system F family protein [Planctomycetales bacterium]